MKRYMIPLVLCLCLCLLAGCGADRALTPKADPETPAYGEGAADGDGTIPNEALPTPADLPGFASLTVEACVEDLWPGEHVLPRIVLGCPGADEINAAIEKTFTSVAEDPLWELRYEAAKGFGDRVLSLVMIQGGPNDWTEYTPYNLDLLTGQALSGPELLELVGQDEAELRGLESTLLGDEFTRQFGSGEGVADAEFFQGQYERTTAADNARTDKLWFGADGTLYFAGRVYGLAGAEYYEYPLSTGLVF